MHEARDITIKGIVQGVGFRPFVYRCAHECNIAGWVLNGTFGVKVHAEGTPENLDAFIMNVHDNAPAAAHIAQMDIADAALEPCSNFTIEASLQSENDAITLVSADLATCAACEQELFDPHNRRYRYPFINCTNCGPRFTIIDKLPYDRPHTSMGSFEMCPSCAEEYTNPLNRRFHAQPDACWNCGPYLSWTHQGSTSWGTTRQESDAILEQAVCVLRAGGILAVKGLGGFHLVCDAENEEALATLRMRKRREGKPFAVMMQNTQSVRELCYVSESEQALLEGSVRPIVLLRLQPSVRLAKGLADNLYELGVMLPYTPLQMLLMHDFVRAGGRMLVMTSGNIHDEPIVTSDEQARETLGPLVQGIIGNNREIRARYDDSVVRVLEFGQAGNALQFVRRARGYAPTPVRVSDAFGAAPNSCVCATGPEQKTTLCFMRNTEAFVTQHIGDVENALVSDAWFETLDRYEQLFCLRPTLLACDKHPEYLTTKWAREQNTARVEVQHHHAHLASVLAENNIDGPALGFAFDGTGYGTDGAIWGGEALLCNTRTFERFGNFAYAPMPGGAAAVKNPLRMAYGVLWAYDLLEHPVATAALAPLENAAPVLNQMIESGINTPYTSSVGRLFDAAAALLGICTQPAYEGEGAVLLEAWAMRAAERPVFMASSGSAKFRSEASQPLVWGSGPAEFRSEASQPSLHSAEPLSQVACIEGDCTVLHSEATQPSFHTAQSPLQPSLHSSKSLGQVTCVGSECVAFRSEASQPSFHATHSLAQSSLHSAEPLSQVACIEGDCTVLHSEATQPSFHTAQSPLQPSLHSANSSSASVADGAVDTTDACDERYRIEIQKNVATSNSTAQDTSVLLFDAAPVFAALLDDMQAGVSAQDIALRFHKAFVKLIVDAAQVFRALYDISTVALSGGVFLNRYLCEHVVPALVEAGFSVALNKEVPPSDGCISLGQAVVACAISNEHEQSTQLTQSEQREQGAQRAETEQSGQSEQSEQSSAGR